MVPRLTNAQRVAYLGGAFSIGVFSAFNNFTMSLWLTSFTSSYVLISLLGNSKSIEGSIVSPLTGIWSDRVWVPWLGRRRPFILVGGLLSALLVALTPTIASLPMPGGLGLPGEMAQIASIVLAVFLFTLTFNMVDDLHKTLRADLAEEAELNFLSSLATIVDIGAQVAFLVLGFLIWSDRVPDSAFSLAGALIAVGVLVTTFGIREPPPEVWATMHSAEANGVAPSARASFATLRARYTGAFMFILVTFFYWSGVNAVLPLLSIFVRDILNASAGEAQLLPGLLLLSTTLMAVPAAWLGTRFGKRRTLAAGYVLVGVAAAIGLVITTKEQGAMLFFLAGLGNSAAVVLAIPLLADLIPRQQMGAGAGLLAAAGALAAPLASFVAGGLADVFGPRAIFAVMGVMVGIAIVLLLGVRTPREVLAEEQSPEG